MSLATEILKELSEFFPLDGMGTLNVKDISSSLKSSLDKYGYPSVNVEVVLDNDLGTFTRFEDKEGDDVIVLFGWDESGSPVASVVSEDDKQIDIDLGPLNPSTVDILNGGKFLNMMDNSWLTKSVVDALMKAGEVNEDATYVLRGKNKIRLPVIKHKDCMSDRNKNVLEKVRSFGWLR